jgi:hypothetical protein
MSTARNKWCGTSICRRRRNIATDTFDDRWEDWCGCMFGRATGFWNHAVSEKQRQGYKEYTTAEVKQVTGNTVRYVKHLLKEIDDQDHHDDLSHVRLQIV